MVTAAVSAIWPDPINCSSIAVFQEGFVRGLRTVGSLPCKIHVWRPQAWPILGYAFER